MKRREFSLLPLAGLGGLVAGSALPGLAQAQATPVEGQQYTRLAQPVPVPASGKIEVVEFFWYGCPHCFAFEPAIGPWSKKLPADVSFRRVHVAFDALKERHQKMYYALEAIGAVEQMHAKVFNRFHVEHKPLNTEADIVAFMAANGVDKAKFEAAMGSFGVTTKMRQAKQMSEAFRIDSVPTIGIQGRFTTSPAQGGSADGALLVANYLIAQVRKGA